MGGPQGSDAAGVLIEGTGFGALGSSGAGGATLPIGGSSITLTASQTLTFPAPIAGGKIDVLVSQDGTGSRVATWAATSGAVKWSGGTHTLSTTASAVDRVAAWSDGTNWYASLSLAYA
jgi:hypothetical protein